MTKGLSLCHILRFSRGRSCFSARNRPPYDSDAVDVCWMLTIPDNQDLLVRIRGFFPSVFSLSGRSSRSLVASASIRSVTWIYLRSDPLADCNKVRFPRAQMAAKHFVSFKDKLVVDNVLEHPSAIAASISVKIAADSRIGYVIFTACLEKLPPLDVIPFTLVNRYVSLQSVNIRRHRRCVGSSPPADSLSVPTILLTEV